MRSRTGSDKPKLVTPRPVDTPSIFNVISFRPRRWDRTSVGEDCIRVSDQHGPDDAVTDTDFQAAVRRIPTWAGS